MALNGERVPEKLQASSTNNNLLKHADRVLKCYRGFKKLKELSDEPFSKHGEMLVNEIDKAIIELDEIPRAILVNQYMTKAKDRKNRKQFCDSHDISIDQYISLREKALTEFSKSYLDGSLLDLK